MDVAFRTRDGSTVLVVHNEHDDPRTFAVAQGGRSFEYTLPGGALATFTWGARLDDGYELLDAERMTATPAAEAAVDDDATTRWTTGAAQAPGQSLQVDLGTTRRISRVVLDTGADRGDFPRGYELSTSRDGVTWSAGRVRRRQRPADDDRLPADHSPPRARDPDRERTAVVVGRRPARIPMRRRSTMRRARTVAAIAVIAACVARRAAAAARGPRVQGPATSRCPSASPTSCRA